MNSNSHPSRCSETENRKSEVERLVTETMRRIDCRDLDAVFAHGNCFIFALRLHERYGYKIRGFRMVEQGPWTHVWAVKDDATGVDIRGVFPEKLLVKLANDGKCGPEPENVEISEIVAGIEKKHYPASLLSKLKRLADDIVDRHERFGFAKPPADSDVLAAIVANLSKVEQPTGVVGRIHP